MSDETKRRGDVGVTNETKIVRTDSKILIEGKWQNIRRLVQDLLDDGWKYTDEPTGEPSGFQFTEVTLQRQFTGSDM